MENYILVCLKLQNVSREIDLLMQWSYKARLLPPHDLSFVGPIPLVTPQNLPNTFQSLSLIDILH